MTEEKHLTTEMVRKYQKVFHTRKDAEVIARAIQKNGIKMLVRTQLLANVFTERFLMRSKRGSQVTNDIVVGAGHLRP